MLASTYGKNTSLVHNAAAVDKTLVLSVVNVLSITDFAGERGWGEWVWHMLMCVVHSLWGMAYALICSAVTVACGGQR